MHVDPKENSGNHVCLFKESIFYVKFENGGGRQVEMSRKDFDQMTYDRLSPLFIFRKFSNIATAALVILNILIAIKLFLK